MNTSQSHIHNQDAGKSPERLEEEVNQTRARIGERLDTLSNRLSPGELLDQALGMAREHGGEFTRNLGAQMKGNPVPLIITGIGMSWLMLASNRPYQQRNSRYRYNARGNYAPGYTDGVSDYPYRADAASGQSNYEGSVHNGGADAEPGIVDKARDAMGRVGDEVEHLKDSARAKIDHASETVHHNMDGMQQHMHSTRQHMHAAGQNMRSAQECVADFLQEQPVLAASLGVALGAAIGALLPATEMEDRMMGDVSDQAVHKAQDLATGEYEKVRETAKEAVENVKQNRRSQTDAPSPPDASSSEGVASQANLAAQP